MDVLAVIVIVVVLIAIVLYVVGVMLGTPDEPVTHCPLCGRALETWIETGAFDGGYAIDREWRNACPVKRDRTNSDSDWMNHAGKWRATNPRAAFDPKSGRPQ